MSFYGDNVRWYVGSVEDINDPLEMGRVRVRIHGIHSDEEQDIPTHGLPWAQVCVPVTEGGTLGLGNILGIQLGARVFGIFLDGPNSQMPMILGTLPKYELTSASGRTTNRLARGTNFVEKSPDRNISEPASPYAATYPDNKVTQTPSGHIIEVDDTNGAERLHVYHKSGTFIEMHPNGDVVTRQKNGWRTVQGNDKLHITGNYDVIVDGDMTWSVRGAWNQTVLGKIDIKGKRIDLNSATATLAGNILFDDPIEYPTNIQPVGSDQVPEDHPANSEQLEPSDATYTPASPVTCGSVPHTNPYDIAKAFFDEGGWLETGSNPKITFLWDEIGYTGSQYADETAWCAVFTGAVLKRSGNKYIKTASSQAYKNYGVEVPIDEIQQGDIVVFYRKGENSGFGHVGFATGQQTDTTIEVLGGNQSNSLTIKTFKKSVPNKGWGIRSIRRAVSCEDGTTEAPAATVASGSSSGTGGAVT